MPFALPAANPAKMASEARFDMTSTTVKLEKAELLAGNGKIERMKWVTGEAQDRGYTANFAVSHYAWNELAVRFTPSADGVVELKLMGPSEEASKGVLYKQELLWRETPLVTGTTLNDFTNRWSGNLTADENPRSVARFFARTWHNEPAATTFRVTKDVPVTIRLHAKAALPDDFKEMRRLDQSSPGFLAAKAFRRGANLGNYLEVPPGQDWGVKYSAEDFAHMKDECFDHVRIPIGWHHYSGVGPDFTLQPEIFGKVDFLVTNALARGLNVILNIHHFDAFTSNPEEQTGKFQALWRQIAAHYAASPANVAFELLNEPKDKATTAALNPIYAKIIRLIRQSNPTRPIFLGPGKWNSIDELPALRLPDDDDNLVVTVHCYDPFYFTHQGSTWSGPDTKVKGIIFPGPPPQRLVPDFSLELNAGVLDWINRYNTLPRERNPSSPKAFRPRLQQAKEWSDYYGRPIHLGEFGAFVGADDESRANFYREFRTALDQLQLSWAIWDWKAGFRYWDDTKNKPAPGLHQALFGTTSDK